MLLQRIDHVGYVVEDLDQAVSVHQRLFDAQVVHRGDNERAAVRQALLAVGDGYLQLLAPTDETSSVARHLAAHGPGLHHVGFGVADVSAALSALRPHGMEVVDDHPPPGGRGCTVAFLHPASTGGVLVELVEDPARGGIELSTGGVPGF